MTWSALCRATAHVEYVGILRRAGEERWLDRLLDAHATSCTRKQAERLLRSVDLPAKLEVNFYDRIFRGRARHRRDRYGISLPTVAGARSAHLRVGLVLHEVAHIWDHEVRRRFGHGPGFCRQLRELLLTSRWRKLMPTRSYAEIYARHRGPFSLLLTRDVVGKRGGIVQEGDRVKGPFSAEEAHEEARVLVNAPKDTVVQVHVFSDGEGQFVGAFYRRGETYRPWGEELDGGRMEPSADEREAALLPERSEPVSEGVVPGGGRSRAPAVAMPPGRSVRGVPRAPAIDPAPVRTRPAPARAAAGVPAATKLPGDRFPSVRGRPLSLGKAEGWPPSAAAQLVREFFQDVGKQATSAEMVAHLGPALLALGVQHPASLVSRLKQAGLLKELT